MTEAERLERIREIYESDFTRRVADRKKWQRLTREQRIEKLSHGPMVGAVFLIGPTYSREKYHEDIEAYTAAATKFVDEALWVK